MVTDVAKTAREKRAASPRKRAADLAAQLVEAISTGSLPVEAKLPTERVLAEEHQLSRNTVRRVLEELEGEGWIYRHVGRGTFVRARNGAETAPSDAADDRADTADDRRVNPEEIMEARLLIEPLLGRLVVARASEAELDELDRIVAAGADVKDMADFEYWDNLFHRAIARAGNNKYLFQIVEGIHRSRRSAAWSGLRRRGLTEARRALYQADHEAIVKALRARDTETAEHAIYTHLQNVRRNLFLI